MAFSIQNVLFQFFQNSTFLQFALALLVLLIALHTYGTWNFGVFKRMGIPGPRPLPLIGTLHYFRHGRQSDLAMFKKYGRLFGTFDGVEPVLVVGDAELVKEIGIKNFDSFPDHRPFPLHKCMKRILPALKGDDWRSSRAIIAPTFSSGKLKKIDPMIYECVQELLRNLECANGGSGHCDILLLCNAFGIDVSGRILFGIDAKTQRNPSDPYVVHVRNMTRVIRKPPLSLVVLALFPILRKLWQLLDIGIFPTESVRYLLERAEKLIELRSSMKDKPTDCLQFLLDARNDDGNATPKSGQEIASTCDNYKGPTVAGARLKDKAAKSQQALRKEEVLAQITQFQFAGSDTSGTTIAHILHDLALHQDVQEKLYQHLANHMSNEQTVTYDNIMKMQYLDQVVSESQRHHFHVPRINRYCEHTCKIGPYTIPQGTIIQFAIDAIHHDEEYWPDPYRFDPERFSPENRSKLTPYTYFPFGVGPRNCVAMRLGQLTVKMAVASVVLNFRLFPGEESEVSAPKNAADRILLRVEKRPKSWPFLKC